MSQTDQHHLTRRAIDEQGRVLPIGDEERRAKYENLRRVLDRLAPGPGDDEGSWKEVYRSIDEGRPERKLFEGTS